MKIKIILNIILPLGIGILIYLVLRPTSYYYILDKNFTGRILVPPWVVYNLNDGLWLYSFLYSLHIIWKPHNPLSYYWYLSIVSIVLISELFQYYHIIIGTFDKNDLTAYLISTIIFTLNLIKNDIKK